MQQARCPSFINIALTALACRAFAQPPPVVRLTFSATLERTYTEYGDDPSPPERTVYSLATSQARRAIWKQEPLSDGRNGTTLTSYAGSCVYSTQPFFETNVCYKFDLTEAQQSTANSSTLWLAASLHEMGLYEDVLKMAKPVGSATMDGRPCEMWEYTLGNSSVPGTTMVSYRFCVDKSDALISLNLTNSYHDPEFVGTTLTTFHKFDPSPPDTFFNAPSKDCVDLTSGKPTNTSTLVNDNRRIALANEEANGVWHASESSVFAGTTLKDAQQHLGTKIRPLQLPLKETAKAWPGFGLPLAFDARVHWPQCKSIGSIRNQGRCGSCWAFAAVEAFADRLCIGGGSMTFSGSAEYMVDCDQQQAGCSGGFLDDAWRFLKSSGIPSEECDPYQYCKNPMRSNCSSAQVASTLKEAAANSSCPSKCKDGSPIRQDMVRAESAYAVSTPGNISAMQLEIMSRGPIEVSFYVFSDFMTYSKGTYFRTKSASGPQGGHAVRILGWGVDEHGTEYWLVANSWSREWGEEGFFRIRRGTNECGIETTPVAGLVSRPRHFDVIV